MKVQVKIEMPAKGMHEQQRCRRCIDKVNEAIDTIEAGMDHVEKEWCYLFKILEEIRSKEPPSARQIAVRNRIEDLMAKYYKSDKELEELSKKMNVSHGELKYAR